MVQLLAYFCAKAICKYTSLLFSLISCSGEYVVSVPLITLMGLGSIAESSVQHLYIR